MTEITKDTPQCRLVINGRPITKSYASKIREKIYASVQDEEAVNEILSHTFAELSNHFVTVVIPYDSDWLKECWYDLKVDFTPPSLYFELSFDRDAWAHPWSIHDVVKRLKDLVNDRQIPGFSFDHAEPDHITSDSGVVCHVADEGAAVGDALGTWLRLLDEVAEQAIAELTAGAAKNTLVTLFEFPGDVATACEQYLLYFVQFLKDLGIEANASIKHEARSVLFSVTPTDGAEALDNVRQALHIYLNLPGTPNVDGASGNYPDIAVQQLQANILHLKSQLTLSAALAQLQRAQIEALQLSNYQFKQLLADRGWTGQTDKESGEPILDGLAEIKPVDFHGVTVNLPEIFRRLKRKVTRS